MCKRSYYDVNNCTALHKQLKMETCADRRGVNTNAIGCISALEGTKHKPANDVCSSASKHSELFCIETILPSQVAKHPISCNNNSPDSFPSLLSHIPLHQVSSVRDTLHTNDQSSQNNINNLRSRISVIPKDNTDKCDVQRGQAHRCRHRQPADSAHAQQESSAQIPATRICHSQTTEQEDEVGCKKHTNTMLSYNKNNRNNNSSSSSGSTKIFHTGITLSTFPFRFLGLDLSAWLRLVFTYLLMAASIHPTSAMPMSQADKMYKKQQMDTVKYLAQFGYLKGPSRETQNLRSREELERAIKSLQKAGGIPQTGVADSRTANLILKPRCGNTDEFIEEGRYNDYQFKSANGYSSSSGGYRHRRSLSRRKRFTTANSSWKNTNLTFRFINYTPDIPHSKTRRIISDALRVWSDATPLSFSEVRQSQADIMIQFATNYHSDGYPFDGRGMVLAHAFFPGPGKGGDTHFDDDENWGTNSSDGVDLFMVAAHEFGHALGLAHSGDPEALMYPWYMGFEGQFKLPQDDYLGITNLYGSKDRNLPMPKSPSKDGVVMIPKSGGSDRNRDRVVTTPRVKDDGSGPPNPCTSHIDALTVFRSELFVFIGEWFWRMDSRKLISKPIEIHSFWYGLPKHLEKVDAAYQTPDNKLVIFSGDRYWTFNNNHLKSGFPTEGRPITEFNIPADIKKIDAAFVWGYNKRTYLVSGDMYWKMNEENTFVEYDYPRDMGTWKGVPVPLDAAFRDWNDKTYFFKGPEYSEFYDLKMKVRKGYPKQFARHMLNCPTPGKEDQVDGRFYKPNAPTPLETEGSSNRLIQNEEASGQEKTTVKNKNNSGQVSVTSSLAVLISAALLSIFANRLSTVDC